MSEHINGYALALFSLAEEEKKLNQYKTQSVSLIESFKENAEYITVMNTKSIHADKKHEMIQKAFKGFDKNLVNFMFVLSDRSKFHLITPVLEKLVKLINNKLRINEGYIYTVELLTKAELAKITKRTETLLNKKLTLINKVDKELISGYKIVVGDELIEDTVMLRLEELKNQLLERKDD